MPGALLAHLRRLTLALAVVLGLGAAFGAAAGLADPAPQQWQPTAADVVRTVRQCPMQISAPAPPVCWSMTEDSSAWMAQPPGSPYPWGQCTYYVGVMRPDIWNDRAPPSVDPLDDWDAWTWVEHAQTEGLSVDGNPQPGDVMVYSRAAVGNDTGHVTMVDSVDGTDASTGDLQLTVSEMNVEGLDDASQGQGDTTTLLLPRSELVPGMIQFIHKPGAGYTPPSWPAGWSDQTAVPAPALQSPSLSAALYGNRIENVSQSPAPLQATVTDLASGRIVKQMTVLANRATAVDLSGGTYQVCLAQAAAGGFQAAQTCVTGAWQASAQASTQATARATARTASRTTIRLGRPHRAGRTITVPATVRPAAAPGAVAAAASVPASVLITLMWVRRARRGRGVRTGVAYRMTLRLRAGVQELRLALPARLRVPARASVSVRVDPARS